MKKILASISLVIMLTILTGQAVIAATPDYNSGLVIKVFVNGNEVEFTDEVPWMDVVNGRVLVPIRFVAESLGAKVGWNNDTQTVTIDRGEKAITLVIGQSQATVNGVVKTFDTATFLSPLSRTMVPLRFVSETLEARVQYEQQRTRSGDLEHQVFINEGMVPWNEGKVEAFEDTPEAKMLSPNGTQVGKGSLWEMYRPGYIVDSAPELKRVTWEELNKTPHEVGGFIVHGISYDPAGKTIKVEQQANFKWFLYVYLIEGNSWRQRQAPAPDNFRSTISYLVPEKWIDDPLPLADIANIREILLVDHGEGKMLAVTNPYFKEE